MNNKIFWLSIPFILVIVRCKTQPQHYITPSQMSWEQVMATAQKYGVQDLIDQSDNSGLVLMEIEDLHVYMLDLKKYIDFNNLTKRRRGLKPRRR